MVIIGAIVGSVIVLMFEGEVLMAGITFVMALFFIGVLIIIRDSTTTSKIGCDELNQPKKNSETCL